jgi:hypothetical protein
MIRKTMVHASRMFPLNPRKVGRSRPVESRMQSENHESRFVPVILIEFESIIPGQADAFIAAFKTEVHHDPFSFPGFPAWPESGYAYIARSSVSLFRSAILACWTVPRSPVIGRYLRITVESLL